jgi:hypothetical protein
MDIIGTGLGLAAFYGCGNGKDTIETRVSGKPGRILFQMVPGLKVGTTVKRRLQLQIARAASPLAICSDRIFRYDAHGWERIAVCTAPLLAGSKLP